MHIYVDGKLVQLRQPTAIDPMSARSTRASAPRTASMPSSRCPKAPTTSASTASTSRSRPTARCSAADRSSSTARRSARSTSCTCVPGGARVAGWALDPDTTASVDIHVYVDGALARIDTRRRAPQRRQHALQRLRQPRTGSISRSRWAPAVATICVYAINQGPGPNPLLGCGGVNVASVPIGALDARATPRQQRAREWDGRSILT